MGHASMGLRVLPLPLPSSPPAGRPAPAAPSRRQGAAADGGGRLPPRSPQLPATVLCKQDAAALCAKCDKVVHDANPISAAHTRIPLRPFTAENAPPAHGVAALAGPADLALYLGYYT